MRIVGERISFLNWRKIDMLIGKNLESDSAKIDRRETNENSSCLYEFIYACNTIVKL